MTSSTGRASARRGRVAGKAPYVPSSEQGVPRRGLRTVAGWFVANKRWFESIEEMYEDEHGHTFLLAKASLRAESNREATWGIFPVALFSNAPRSAVSVFIDWLLETTPSDGVVFEGSSWRASMLVDRARAQIAFEKARGKRAKARGAK